MDPKETGKTKEIMKPWRSVGFETLYSKHFPID